MRTILTLLVCGLAAVFLPGCASVERTLNNLPQVSAAEIHLATSNPLGSAQLDAINLQQTPTQVTADSINVQVSAPFVGTTTVTLKGYVRDKRVPVVADPPPAQ